MGAPKGTRPPSAGIGRVAGIPNKITGDVKAMILAALDGAGGAAYLIKQATANPAAFMTLVGKVLPLQVAGVPGQPIELAMTLEQKRETALREIDEAFAERPRPDDEEK